MTAIQRKIARALNRESLRTVDLFAGCGGISLGFQRAGFELIAAAELDPLAARSHAENLFRHQGREAIELHAMPRDLTKVEPHELIEEFAPGVPVEEAVDVLVGGPPCQAYARVGRAKLREVAERPDAYKVDPRGNLYLRYLHYVRVYQPLALMMENVPDILHYGGHNIVQEIVEALADMGYDARYSLINSAFHGVPQMRDRIFLIAYRRELHARIRFPQATRHMKLPSGYDGTRAVALKHVDQEESAFVPADMGTEDLPFPVTASEALGDLPPITLHLEGKLRRGARRFTDLIRYSPQAAISPYAEDMRTWPGFESAEGVKDHVIRSLPRDTQIFRHMEPGTEYPAAHGVATRLFEEEAARRRLAEGTEAYEELQRRMVPPYPVKTFPNRWWKLRADYPVRTLMAHIGKDTYSHIHYDGNQGRTISVREAARLQSFPDGFVYTGTMNPAFRQIGNAVPPLMAFAIADTIRETLEQALGAMEPVPAAAE